MKPLALLVADDDDEDVLLLEQALAEAGWSGELLRARNGRELLARLAHLGLDRRLLVLLDLRMAGLGGLAALRRLKADPGSSAIPVVVLSGMDSEGEAAAAYSAGASGYLRKPARLEGYGELARRLLDYWGAACVVPRAGEKPWSSASMSS